MPINSRRKGNNAEREVCKILSKHFGGKFERRSMGIAGSDIVAPDDFPYAVEVKHHKTVRAIHLFKGHNQLRKWWKQTEAQASGKRPLLIVKVEGSWFCTTWGQGWDLLNDWCAIGSL
jgi:Holliday junction resolvase